ncbi:GNAT family N-acetyltransferase [Streptomyces sp. NPDC101062]|uniref:GNAT family N-acetyltransferase n=1 Tax=unclassified Streptomyces TaxID=2593676 RepID=UPI0037FA22C1
MDKETVLKAFDRDMRLHAGADGSRASPERVGNVVRRSGGPHDWNGVLWSDLDENSAPAAIAEQVAHFTGLGLESEWKLYSHDAPAGLGRLLLAAGFVAEPTEALMVAEVKDLLDDAEPPEGIRLVPVTDAAGVALMADVHDQAFGTDGSRIAQQLLGQLTEFPDTVSAVVAVAGDVPVSAARLELPPGKRFAGLWGGGTTEEWRGKGIYRALVTYRARIAAARGYPYLQVDATDMSRPILERLGFTVLSTTTPYVHTPWATGPTVEAEHESLP